MEDNQAQVPSKLTLSVSAWIIPSLSESGDVEADGEDTKSISTSSPSISGSYRKDTQVHKFSFDNRIAHCHLQSQKPEQIQFGSFQTHSAFFLLGLPPIHQIEQNYTSIPDPHEH